MAQIIGTPRNDNLVGTNVTNSPTGADDIFGLAGNDRIDGRSGNDRLFGGPGADRLLGNLGDDLLFGEDDDDLMRGGSGDDQLFGGNGRDLLLGDDGDDLLAGDGGDDDLLGGSGGDALEGGDGDDNLFGDAGDDVLDGGPGSNRLSGDADADRFLLTDFDVDEILDLNLAEGDVVDFSALAEEALSAGLLLGDAVRLEAGPFGTTLLVDVGDSNRFQEAVLLRGVDPVVEVISPGELVALARPVAVPLVSLSLAALDGTNGFRLYGAGISVSGAATSTAIASPSSDCLQRQRGCSMLDAVLRASLHQVGTNIDPPQTPPRPLLEPPIDHQRRKPLGTDQNSSPASLWWRH